MRAITFAKTFILTVSAMLAASCVEPLQNNNSSNTPSVTLDDINVKSDTKFVTLSATVSNPSVVKVAGFYVSEDKSMTSPHKIDAKVGATITAEYLPEGYGRTYYVKACIGNGQTEKCTEAKQFTTGSLDSYVSLSASIQSVTSSSAMVKAALTTATGVEITSKGFCYGAKENVTIADNVIEVTSSEFKAEVPCSKGTYVRAYVKDGGEVAYSPAQVTVDMPTAVDLGLSVKWASCNVGATAPEDCGFYFAWGEVGTKSVYNWANLKYCTGGDDVDNARFSKYVTNVKYGPVDDKTLLDLSDDAAHVNWGEGWRMPTEAEFRELIETCVWKWIFEEGKSGYEVKSKSKGTSIFLPAAGWYDHIVQDSPFVCSYWSSSLGKSVSSEAVYLYGFAPSNAGNDDYHSLTEARRCVGFSVRPVSE